MNIAITGGSGFVGSRLIEELKKNAENLILNIDKHQSAFYPEITIIGNILDKVLLKKVLQNQDIVLHLAAEHSDDVTPKSLYYDVNVQGMKNVLEAMNINSIKKIIFTSSVAVYGLNKKNPNEDHPIDPFNEYGKTKWLAEQLLQEWYKKDITRNVNIIRPTVIFGERNRGNVYNLLRQIALGRFLMVGNGNNKKSMAYVGNIVSFIHYLMDYKTSGYNAYNYVDNPDFTMNELMAHVGKVLNKKIPITHIPYVLGMIGGYGFDLIAKISGKKMNISSVRVQKFCATTQFDATKVQTSSFKPPFTLNEGLAKTLKYEFLEKRDKDDITFISE